MGDHQSRPFGLCRTTSTGTGGAWPSDAITDRGNAPRSGLAAGDETATRRQGVRGAAQLGAAGAALPGDPSGANWPLGQRKFLWGLLILRPTLRNNAFVWPRQLRQRPAPSAPVPAQSGTLLPEVPANP
jgi:hypothetical protein